MLKFLRETLSIGDFVEVETFTGLVRGSILEIPPDCLVMLTDGELHEYSEEQLLSIKYFSDDHDAYRDCYIQKFIPEEKSERYFFGRKPQWVVVLHEFRQHHHNFYGLEYAFPTRSS